MYEVVPLVKIYLIFVKVYTVSICYILFLLQINFLVLGGPAQRSHLHFFCCGNLFFFEARNLQKLNQLPTDPTNRHLFFDIMKFAVPHARKFSVSPLKPTLMRSIFGDRHTMLNHFQHGVTISFCCFFCHAW